MTLPPVGRCVICGKEATGTAAHVLVCDEHRRMYDEEGRKYLPPAQRTFYQQLLNADKEKNDVEQGR